MRIWCVVARRGKYSLGRGWVIRSRLTEDSARAYARWARFDGYDTWAMLMEDY